jgi:Amidohydrolase family
MMDTVIRNGVLVDGSGIPRFRGDLGIDRGRIVALGEVAQRGNSEIDAAGAVIAPGFIDIHTHYDAQAFWDPMLSPSVFHGVTTVLAGNCGFSLAPLSGRPEDADYLLRMLSRVEGMPLATLRAAGGALRSDRARADCGRCDGRSGDFRSGDGRLRSHHDAQRPAGWRSATVRGRHRRPGGHRRRNNGCARQSSHRKKGR